MNLPRAIRIGVLADTHGLFDPAIAKHFRAVDHIVHAGDIGKRTVIAQLEELAPVTAVSGNVDGYEKSGYPSETVIELSGVRIAIRHIQYEGGKADARRASLSGSHAAGHLYLWAHPSAKE
jgi:putative phosphoesterase